MAKAPTVEDVAERAGVSRQTVSNVLNTPDIVRPATRERVLTAIRELGYRRHAAARQLRLRRSSTIGIRLDPYLGGVSGVVLDRFVHAITERASERRHADARLRGSHAGRRRSRRLSELWEGSEIDAAIITGTIARRSRACAASTPPACRSSRSGGPGARTTSPTRATSGSTWTVPPARARRPRTRSSVGTQRGLPRLAVRLREPGTTGNGAGERRWLAAGAHGMRLIGGGGRAARAGICVDAALAGRSETPDAMVCASDSLAVGALLAVNAAGGLSLPGDRLRQHSDRGGPGLLERRAAPGGRRHGDPRTPDGTDGGDRRTAPPASRGRRTR
jgi:hypothetical protein